MDVLVTLFEPDWRTEQFERLGFDRYQAALLSEAKHVAILTNGKRYETPIHASEVVKLLENGCSHELVIRILT